MSRASPTLSLDRPAVRQPYHEAMDLSWDEAVARVLGPAREIEKEATRRLEALIETLRGAGLIVKSVAIVGAPERNLRAIGSPHIRAHAAEGVLFRRVWQVAAASIGLPSETFGDKGIEACAAARLGLSLENLGAALSRMGRVLGRPWRADEKAAALAAWMALPDA